MKHLLFFFIEKPALNGLLNTVYNNDLHKDKIDSYILESFKIYCAKFMYFEFSKTKPSIVSALKVY